MEDKTIVLDQCATNNMVADALTKGLPAPAFEKHKEKKLGKNFNTCSVYVTLATVYKRQIE